MASVPPEHTTPGRRQGSHGYASSGGWGGGGEDGLSLEIATQWGAGGGEEEVLAGGSRVSFGECLRSSASGPLVSSKAGGELVEGYSS